MRSCAKTARSTVEPMTDDADDWRTRSSPLRAAISDAPHGCGLERHFSSSLWCKSRLERQPQSALRLWGDSGDIERYSSNILRFRGPLERYFSGILRFRGRLATPVDHSAASGQAQVTLFEHSGAAGWAQAAISSNLRLWSRLEWHFDATVGNMGMCSVFEQ